jgi:hypothetical protein
MALIYLNWHKTVMTVCFTSLFSLALYSFSSLAKGQTIKSHKPQFSNPEGNLLKCGWEKEINLKLPLWHLLSRSPKEEGNRVESPPRCARSLPTRLTALIPESNVAITVAKYPTFFFYIPDANLALVKHVELVILDQNRQVVYQKTVKLKSRDTIVSIALSDSPSLPPLEIGKSYNWSFSVAFDEIDRSDESYVTGWIKRVSLDSKLQHKLNTALPQQNPDHANFSSDWESLLQQVGLPEIAKKPLAQCN